MFAKYKLLVLFLALGAFATPESFKQSSAPFSFVQTGVLQQYFRSQNGSYFSYRKLANSKQGILFSWSINDNQAQTGKLSIYNISGKLIQSFDVTSRQKYVTWSMPQAKIASGVYFAVLNLGSFKKNAKIMF
jgi:hypothetical protein